MGLATIVHTALVHIPHQYGKHQERVSNQRNNLKLYDGLESIIFHRIVSKSWEDWQNEWFWMASSLIGSVWSSLYMATSPSIWVEQEYQEAAFDKKD